MPLRTPARLALAFVLASMATALPQDVSTPSQAESDVMRHLDEAAALFKDGRYPQARERVQEAMAIAEKELGEDHPLTTACLSWLGGLMKKSGDLKGARAAFERVLAIDLRVFGEDHPGTARSLNNLANVIQDGGDPGAAKALHERALAIREKAMGPDSPETAGSLTNLALCLVDLGEHRKARSLLERALAVYERTLGAEDIRTLGARDSLGTLLGMLGDPEGAIALLEGALEINEKVLGVEHPDLAINLNNLAGVYEDLGDPRRARPLYERALRIQEKAFGPDHPERAASLTNLAFVLRDLGDYAGARDALDRALSIREKSIGLDHPKTAASLTNLAGLLDGLGDLPAAVRLFERALASHEQALGSEHPRTLMIAANLAAALADAGDLPGAKSIYERLLIDRACELATEHPDTPETLRRMARVERALGDSARASSTLHLALRVEESRVGTDHPQLAAVLLELAILFGQEGKEAERDAFLARALSIQERAFGLEHPHAASYLSHMGNALWEAGRRDEAKKLFDRAWSGTRKMLETILPVLSSRERWLALRQRKSYLTTYLNVHADTPRETWAAAIAWKGGALRAGAASLRIPADASDEVRRVAEELFDARRSLAGLILSTSGSRAGTADRFHALRAHVEELERRLSKLRPELAVWTLQELSPDDVQGLLPPGAALIDLLESSGYVEAWVARRDGEVTHVDLGKASEIESLARRFREAIESDDQKAWLETGRALRERLGEPVAAALKEASALFVSPDGALATIPWGLLPEGDGFLLERLPVVCVSGCPSLAKRPGAVPPASDRGLLALGDVDYAGLDRPVPALAATRKEVEDVESRFRKCFPKSPCRRLTGKDAAESSFESDGPRARYIHIATHGFFELDSLRAATAAGTRGLSGKAAATLGSTEVEVVDVKGWNPLLLSGIVLAPSPPSDGWLTAEELQGLDLRGVELVVLSACGTGRGELAAGEGVLGLSRALSIAGAGQFVLSLWKVPDVETGELMDAFYEGLWQDAVPTAEALRRAQLSMLAQDRENGRFRPSSWGAWILTQ